MKKLFSRIVKFPAMGILFCFWTAIASAQTNYNFSFSPNQTIPDDNFSGVGLTTNLGGMLGYITNVSVSLNISGGYNGDLYAYLRGPNGGFAVLLNRVGVTNGNAFGYGDTGFNVTFNDSSNYSNIHFYQNLGYTLNGNGQLTGNWSSDGRNIDPLSDPADLAADMPTSLLDSFNGSNPNGDWTLFLADLSGGDDSTLENWQLNIATVPEPSSGLLFAIGAFVFSIRRPELRRRFRIGIGKFASKSRCRPSSEMKIGNFF